MCQGLNGFCAFEASFHSRPTDARGLFRCTAAVPVGLETNRIVITHLLECAELPCPIYVSFIDWRPLDLVISALDCILAVAVVNSVFWNQIPTRPGTHRVHCASRHCRGPNSAPGAEFSPRSWCVLIRGQSQCCRRTHSPVREECPAYHKSPQLTEAYRRWLDGMALHLPAPEIEAANFVGVKLLCQSDRTFQD